MRSYLFDADTSGSFPKVSKDSPAANKCDFEEKQWQTERQSSEKKYHCYTQESFNSVGREWRNTDQSVNFGRDYSLINPTFNCPALPIRNKAQYLKSKIDRKKENVLVDCVTLKSYVVCTLCMRRFKSIEKLRRHEILSSLHQANLAKSKSESRKSTKTESARAGQGKAPYSMSSDVSRTSVDNVGNTDNPLSEGPIEGGGGVVERKVGHEEFPPCSPQGEDKERNLRHMELSSAATNENSSSLRRKRKRKQKLDNNPAHTEDINSNDFYGMLEKSLQESTMTCNKSNSSPDEYSSVGPMDILSDASARRPNKMKGNTAGENINSSLIMRETTSNGPVSGENSLFSHDTNLLQHFEVITTSKANIAKKRNGYNSRIVAGQVGLRCIHCKSYCPSELNHSTSIFLSKVECLKNFKSFVIYHMKTCVAPPKDTASSYKFVSTVKPDGRVGSFYSFNRKAEVHGLENAEKDVRFKGRAYGEMSQEGSIKKKTMDLQKENDTRKEEKRMEELLKKDIGIVKNICKDEEYNILHRAKRIPRKKKKSKGKEPENSQNKRYLTKIKRRRRDSRTKNIRERKDVAKMMRKSSHVVRDAYSETSSIASSAHRVVCPNDYYHMMTMTLKKCAPRLVDL